MDLSFNDADRDAAWELYIELVTRITTQSLDEDDGDEKSALDSIYKIFSLTLFQISDTMAKNETDNNYDLIKTEKRWFYYGAFADP